MKLATIEEMLEKIRFVDKIFTTSSRQLTDGTLFPRIEIDRVTFINQLSQMNATAKISYQIITDTNGVSILYI